MRFLSLTLVTFLILTTQAAAEDVDAGALRKAALGKWERFPEFEGQLYRLVKDIKEKEESLTLYSLSGDIEYQHVVEYDITVEDNLGIFSYWNRRVIVSMDGDGSSAAPDDVRRRYAFRIVDNKWYEAQGFFGEATGKPVLNVYEKPRLPDVARKEMGYFVGSWKTEGRTGSVKSAGTWATKWAPGFYCLTIDTGYQSEGSDRGGRSVGIMGWDAGNETILMQGFWSFNESYTLVWKPVSDSVWEGKLQGVEDTKTFATPIKLTKKSADEFVYESKNAAGEEIEVVFRKQ